MEIETRKNGIKFDEAIVGCGSEVLAETDIILPEHCPDIMRILQVDATAHITEKEIGGDNVFLRGEVSVTVIYTPDPQMSDSPAKSITATASFTDVCQSPGVSPDMKIHSLADVSSIDWNLINSRKLNIKSTVHTEIKATRCGTTEFVSEVFSDMQVETLKSETQAFTGLFDDEFEVTVSDKLEVPAGKPAASEILKINASVTDCDVKLLPDKCIVKGICAVSTLYVSLSDSELQFMEHEIPFTEVLDTPGADDDMDADVDFTPCGIYYETDESGEGITAIGVEVKLNCSVNITGEQTVEYISDCYSPECDLSVSRKLCKVDRIEKMTKPQISIKGAIPLDENCPSILQLYNISAKPFIERVTHENNIVNLEGHLAVNILYLTTDPDMPLYGFKSSVPFTHSVTVDTCTDFIVDCNIHLENCSYTLPDERTISIRATAAAGVKIICNDSISVIEDIKATESKAVRNHAMIIYFVQPDDTMWSVAKKYRTTIDRITQCNSLSSAHSLTPGTKILIPTT